MSYVHNNFGEYKSKVDAVVAINDIYFRLLDVMKRDQEMEPLAETGMNGIRWAESGGESTAILNEDYLAADGIDNVRRVLEEIENGNIQNVKFVELNACPGGCVGGAMTVANPYIAQARLQALKRYLPVSPNRPISEWIPDEYFNEKGIEYNPANLLSDDRRIARQMMKEIESIRESLPQIDCGSCGAPTCMAFAEDIVKGEATADECTVIMKMLFHQYLDEHKEKSVLDKLAAEKLGQRKDGQESQ